MPSPDPNDVCPQCNTAFGYTSEDDPLELCRPCDQVFHTDCLDRHACPKRVMADATKLRAWELACADGRKP